MASGQPESQRPVAGRPEARKDVSKVAGGLTSRANNSARRAAADGSFTSARARRPPDRRGSAAEAPATTAATTARSATVCPAVAISASPLTPRSAVTNTSKPLKRKSSSGAKAVRATTARAEVAGPNVAPAPHSAAIPAAAPAASMANRRLSEFGLPSPGAMAALLRQPTVDQPTQTTYRRATGERPSPASRVANNLQLAPPAKSPPPGVEGHGSQMHPSAQEPTLSLDARLATLDDKAGDRQETTEYLGTLDRDGLLPKALAKALAVVEP